MTWLYCLGCCRAARPRAARRRVRRVAATVVRGTDLAAPGHCARVLRMAPAGRSGRRTGNPHETDRRRLVVVTVLAMMAVIATVTVLLLTRDQNAGSPGPGSAPSATTGTAPTQPTDPTAEPTSEPTSMPTPEPSGRRSAAEALGPFLSRAATLDRRLTEAAAAINAAGPRSRPTSRGSSRRRTSVGLRSEHKSYSRSRSVACRLASTWSGTTGVEHLFHGRCIPVRGRLWHVRSVAGDDW